MDINKKIRDFENFLSSLKLNSNLRTIKTFEFDSPNIPSFSKELNRLFFIEQKWLNFEEFYDFYINKHKIKNLFKGDWNKYLLGLKARLYRVQFGFLTEFHAFLLAKKNIWE